MPVIPIPWRVRERIPFTGIRRTIAERLRHSQSAAVSLTLQREVCGEALAEARAELNQKVGSSVPFDAFFVKFLAQALRERPELNAVIAGDECVVLDEVNVGFACSTARRSRGAGGARRRPADRRRNRPAHARAGRARPHRPD